MDLYPAIDLRGGNCVRLLRGDYDAETVYGTDPVAVASRFVADGARWIHTVDLDAARSGSPVNLSAVAAIAEVADRHGVSVQAGGGVRDHRAARRLWSAGIRRVVIGTAAVEDPTLVESLVATGEGEVAVGLDLRGRQVAVHGWTRDSGVDVFDLIERLADAGVHAFVVTQIDRDGTLDGPDLNGLTDVLEATDVAVIASGGVGGPDDIEALAGLHVSGRRLSGVIAGKAIYEGHLDVASAIAIAGGGDSR